MGSVVNRAMMLKKMSFGGMAAISKDVYHSINEVISKGGFGQSPAPSMTFHCSVPGPTVGSDVDVYCMLPASLEQRLLPIQKAMKSAKAATQRHATTNPAGR